MTEQQAIEKAAELQSQLGDFCKANNVIIFSVLTVADSTGKANTRAVIGGDTGINVASITQILDRWIGDTASDATTTLYN